MSKERRSQIWVWCGGLPGFDADVAGWNAFVIFVSHPERFVKVTDVSVDSEWMFISSKRECIVIDQVTSSKSCRMSLVLHTTKNGRSR